MKTHLSPKELARAIGVSESSLKRWADGGRIRGYRTAGGHRRIELSEAVRFIRESAMPVREPQLLGLAELDGPLDLHADGTGQAGDPAHALDLALENGESAKARSILTAMYLAGQDVAAICDAAIAPAMHRLGELWQHRGDGIMIEHRATDICIGALNQLRALLPAPEADAPLALGGAPPGDPYLLPSLMAATVTAAEGWRATNLGPESPVDLLVDAAKGLGARLVWLSLSVAQPTEQIMREVGQLADQVREAGVSIVVGGRALPQPLKLTRPHLHVARSMTELAAFAKGLRVSREAPQARTTEAQDAG